MSCVVAIIIIGRKTEINDGDFIQVSRSMLKIASNNGMRIEWLLCWWKRLMRMSICLKCSSLIDIKSFFNCSLTSTCRRRKVNISSRLGWIEVKVNMRSRAPQKLVQISIGKKRTYDKIVSFDWWKLDLSLICVKSWFAMTKSPLATVLITCRVRSSSDEV